MCVICKGYHSVEGLAEQNVSTLDPSLDVCTKHIEEIIEQIQKKKNKRLN